MRTVISFLTLYRLFIYTNSCIFIDSIVSLFMRTVVPLLTLYCHHTFRTVVSLLTLYCLFIHADSCIFIDTLFSLYLCGQLKPLLYLRARDLWLLALLAPRLSRDLAIVACTNPLNMRQGNEVRV